MEVMEGMVSTFPLMQDFVSLRDAMDQLLEDSFTAGRGQRGTSGAVARPMPLDVYATQDEAVVVAAVPGMSPEDLEVTINQGTVTLSGRIGNVAESEEAKGATWYLHELWHGQFRRAVSLPFEVDAAKTEATFEHGILRIRLPKAEQAKPKKIEIKAGGSAQAIGAGAQN